MRFIHIEVLNRLKLLTTGTPRRTFWCNLSLGRSAVINVCTIAFQMRERNVVHIPEQLSRASFPRLNVFDAQLAYRLDLFFAPSTDVVSVLFQLSEQNHLTKSVHSSTLRHA